MNISEAQKTVQQLLGVIEHPRLASFIALTEEVGEVANEVMQAEIYAEVDSKESREAKKRMADEMSDVLVSLLELANVYDVDLEAGFKGKIENLTPRVAKWENTLAPILKAKRDKLN